MAWIHRVDPLSSKYLMSKKRGELEGKEREGQRGQECSVIWEKAESCHQGKVLKKANDVLQKI